MSKIVSQEVRKFVDQNLNEKFFEDNVPNGLSSYRILDFTIFMDGLDEEIIKQLPENKKKRIEEENKMVDNEEDLNKLYNMLRKELSPRTVSILVNKLVEHKHQIIPRILEDLKRSGNDNFIEAAARVLIKPEDNYSKELADILPNIKYPYAQAVACYALGKIGSEEHIEVLYNYFNKFKKDYKDETYFEGPLMGLYELKERYGF